MAVAVTVTGEHHLWSLFLKSGGFGFNGVLVGQRLGLNAR